MLCALLLKAFTVVLPSKTCRAYLRLHAATCHYIAFLKGNFREVVLSYMSSYGSVQSSILRRIWCSTLVEQRMQRPAAKSNENCEGKKCAPQGARSSKKKSILWESRKTGAVGIAKESRSRLPLENTHISMKMHEYAASSAITCSKYLLETLAGNTCLKQT